MKKFLTFVLVLAMVMSVSSFAMAATTHTVNNQTELDAALASLQDGDELIINAGTYSSISINKPNVTVTGVGDVVVNGKGSFTGANFTVDNIDFINSGTAFYIWGYGTVKNCKISGSNGLYQSYLTTGQTANFINCEIYGGTYGIHFDSTTDGNYGGSIIIDGCTFAGWNSFGDKITNITISNSTFNHNGTYGQLRFYQNATVTNCTFDPKMSIDGNLSSEETVVINNSSTKDGSSLADRVRADLGEDFQVNGALVVKDQATLTAALQDSTVTSIVLCKDIETTGAIKRNGGSPIVIDLNGKTLSLGNSVTSTGGADVTFKNGKISLDNLDLSANSKPTACFWVTQNSKLSFEDVDISGTGVDPYSGVFYCGAAAGTDDSVVNITGGSIKLPQLKNSFFRTEKATAQFNAKNTNIELTDLDPAARGFMTGTVNFDNSKLLFTGGDNAMTGIKLTAKDSEITVNGSNARALTLDGRDAVIDNTDLNFSNCAEGEIRFKNDATLEFKNGSNLNKCSIYADDGVTGAKVKGTSEYTVTGNVNNRDQITVVNDGLYYNVDAPAPSDDPNDEPTTTAKPSGSGISVKYNGGNSFSTSNPSVPTGVEIDGVPVTFNGTGSNFSVGCISSDAKWVTVRWNSTSVTTNFTPDGLVECTTVSLPKTGDMSIWAAIAQFLGV